MNLNETLTLIAAQIKADAKQLIAYAEEDAELGGYHINEQLRAWPMGSAWAVELQTLYALIRQFKPSVVVEIGGWVGASASHMALACKRNGVGHVTSVDNGVGGQPHGYLIPDYLRELVTLVPEDGRVWLAKQNPQSIGFLFEDADHSTPLVMELSRLAMSKIEAGGILATHDAGHDFALVGGGQRIDSPVGRAVRDGLAQAGLHFTPYLAEPSDCGLAITVMPGVKRTTEWKRGEIKAGGTGEKWTTGNEHEYRDKPPSIELIGNAHIESASEPPAPTNEDMRLIAPMPPGLRNENKAISDRIEKKKPATKRKPKTKAK